MTHQTQQDEKQKLMDAMRDLVPKLTHSAYKGQAGKVAVIGGCLEYTGAPYFAAISAMKLGADLSHIFCETSAAIPIKSYSPDLIVHPVLPSTSSVNDKSLSDEDIDNYVKKVSNWFTRLDVLVIGPGLGRDSLTLQCVARIISKAREEKLPLVIDGDGLFLITNSPELIRDYPHAILTPNVNEYKRLAVGLKEDENVSPKALAKKLGHVTIVRKGETDTITNGHKEIECTEEGSLRRVGGQGDILAGSIGTFLAWATKKKDKKEGEQTIEEKYSMSGTLLAGYAGCYITKATSKLAFAQHNRSTITSNMIEHIGQAFTSIL